MSSRIPEEIWLGVISELPRETMLELSQADRKFQRILRPYIFAEFDFCPYTFGLNGEILLPSSIEWSLKRLAFWTSPEIAPFVSICDMQSHSRPRCRRERVSTGSIDDPYTLLLAFFERVVRFTNLRSLSCFEMPLTQTFLTNLCRLPQLVTLSLTNCREVPGIDFSRLRFQSLRDLTLKDNFSPPATDHSHWLALLRPELLTDLEIRLNSENSPNIDRQPSFPRVTKLTLALGSSNDTPNIRRFLAKFPGLETLEICEHPGQQNMKAAKPLGPAPERVFCPPLTAYKGPVWTLNIFLHLPTLTHLEIAFCFAPSDFITQVQTAGVHSSVISLRFSVFTLTSTELSAVCEFFPSLTRLRVDIWAHQQPNNHPEGQGQVPQAFLETLAESTSALPPRLTQIALAWPKWNGEIDDAVYPAFRRDLTAKYPSANAIWLCHFNSMRLWRKTNGEDEEIKETAVTATGGISIPNKDDFAKVDTMREKYNSTWDEVEYA
ncbi:hypothetical protein C8R46DRAFT_1271657 [Mycena filopes]|nr:hypothetical protein C8R46DRAFT_1271657 [Mycena filopes]